MKEMLIMNLNLGSQIRLNHRRMNLTHEQMAEKFGTSRQAISRWETSQTYPDIEMLPMIASFFSTSVDAMLGCTEIDLIWGIRCSLREYHSYWFWGMYDKLFRTQLFRNERVLDEMRLL